MDRSWVKRRLRLTVGTLAVVLGATAVLAAVGLIGANHLRGPIIRFVAARTGRQITVDGSLSLHLLSIHPSVIAERVLIGNPPWTPPGTMAEIGRLTLVYDLPVFAGSFAIRRLEMEAATLHLARDETGRANWQWTEPGKGKGKGPPLIRGLSIPNAHVMLDDALRHLKFDGTVSAQDANEGTDPRPLRIVGAGQLNGQAANLALNGDPLATVRLEHPYHFDFTEESSGSHLAGRGVLPRPFDVRFLDISFDASGEDMRDLYFLTGVRLPDTGAYRLSGKLAREQTHFTYSDLTATSGRSDVHGALSIEIASGHAHVEADLNSQLLRLSDLGARAAGRGPEPGAKQFVFSDTAFRLNGMRGSDAVVSFHAQGMEAGHVSLHAVAAKVTINQGVITVAPLSAALQDGKISGEVKVNILHDVPLANVDLRIANLALSRMGRQDSPPVDGLLQARLKLSGAGRSLHELAAGANGTVTAVLPHGAIRASFAELGGLDLRGLGLMLTRNEADTAIRCGVASFKLKEGTLTAQTLVLDTDPVLITGAGTLQLDSEALDFNLSGRSKRPRLRLRAPVLIRGTLAHPSVGIGARKTAVQAGAAVALGVLLSPVAAMLAFVDPGLARDADCAALLAKAKSDSKVASVSLR